MELLQSSTKPSRWWLVNQSKRNLLKKISWNISTTFSAIWHTEIIFMCCWLSQMFNRKISSIFNTKLWTSIFFHKFYKSIYDIKHNKSLRVISLGLVTEPCVTTTTPCHLVNRNPSPMSSHLKTLHNLRKWWKCGLKLALLNWFMLYINPSRAKFFRGNKNMYSQFMSFLHIDMAQVVEILSQANQRPTYYTVNIMAADVLAMKGARASATMILT